MGFFNKLKELKYREEIGLVEELIQKNAWINESSIEKMQLKLFRTAETIEKKQG